MASKLMEMIEEKTKRQVPDEITAARVSSHWKLIKSSINKSSNDPKKLDKKLPKVVGHGVHLVNDIDANDDLDFVVFNNFHQRYVGVSHSGKLAVFMPSGYQEPVCSTYLNEALEGIVYISRSRQYVGWGKDSNLKLLSENFEVVSTASAVSRVHCAVYNEATNEVLTGGVGNITVWSFRYGQRFLLQRKVLTESVPSSSAITAICLEDTTSRSQRCFVAYDNSVIIFTILNGSLLAHFKEIHPRQITSILFFNPLKYLVTAAKDGSIKVWDDKCNIKIVFVGHLNCVSSVAIYPFGPYIMSCSTDCTIRIWSLDTCDEVDRIQTKQPVKGLGTVVGNDNLFSYSGSSLQLWKIEHVHSVFTTVGCKVKSIKAATHPRMPIRMVCTCSDATVRLISPGSGACITTLLVPRMITVRDTVYAAAESLLFTLLMDGRILKCSTATNPCDILEEWEKTQTGAPASCTCLCLYEYVVEDKMAGDSWTDLVTTLKAKQKAEEFLRQNSTPGKTAQNAYDRTILLAGCMDGTIVVFDWQNEKKHGTVSFQIEAHREEIVCMVANPSVDQVVSAGLDNTIKVWRLFPFAQEALAPLLTLHCQETPRHLSVAHHRLSVAFHEPATASYNVVVFKTTQKERFDHNSEDDHTDDVMGLTTCPKMRLFASCSSDGTVRIWDEANALLRIIRLNATPTSLCFCSQKGDLLVGIGNHLHKIEYWKYMPQSYIYRMVAMEFRRVPKEKPFPIEPEVKNRLSSSQLQRLTRAKSSIYKFTQFADTLSQEELDERVAEEEKRQEAYGKLQERENELRKLRDGVFEYTRKRPRIDTEEVRAEGFNRYLEMFYKRPNINIPDDDDLEEQEGPEYEEEDCFVPERPPTGFFNLSRGTASSEAKKKPVESPTKSAKEELASLSMPTFEPVSRVPEEEMKESEGTESKFQSQSAVDPIRPSFSRPSPSKSIKSAPLHGREFKKLPIEPPVINRYSVDVPRSSNYPSPTHSRTLVARQVSQNATISNEEEDPESFAIAPDGFIPNSVVVAMFKDLRSEPEEEVVKEWKPPQLSAQQLAELESRKKQKTPKSPVRESSKKVEKTKSKFAVQMELALREVTSPEPTNEEELFKSPTPTPPQSPEPVKEPTPPPPNPPSPKKEVRPVRPIEKFVTRPKPPTPPPPTPPKELTPPPPPPTPLPDFVTQFQGTWWFQKFFPNAEPESFPKPWSVSSFIELLLKFIKMTPEFEFKIQLSAAIMLLNRQYVLERDCCDRVSRAMVTELNVPDAPSAHGESNAKQFIRVAVQLMEAMKVYDVSVVAELMAQFIDGDEETRTFVQEIFVLVGVHDPAGYFAKEMDSFEVWEIPGRKRKSRIREVCIDWVEKWLGQFRNHIRTLASKIGRAQSGRVVKGTKSPQTPPSIKGILKTDGKKSQASPARSTGISFEMDTLGGAASDRATPVEAINYFCEVQLQEQLERAKARQAKKPTPSPQDNSRNTVLVLPDIHSKRSLARLGETHCSHCHPERETSLALSFHLPPVYQSRKTIILNNVALHLNTLTLNPFPDQEDKEVYEAAKHHPLLTLRTSQKYFIPSQSYVEPDPAVSGLQNLRI